MKTLYALSGFFLLLILPQLSKGNGLAVVDIATNSYLSLLSDSVDVQVHEQIAIVTSRQRFYNYHTDSVSVKFAFPLPEGATTTDIRWKIQDVWYEAVYAEESQNEELPSSDDVDMTDINQYLGPNPLFFQIYNQIPPNEEVLMEISYVMLLPYEFGVINLVYPMDTDPLDPLTIGSVYVDVHIDSQRTIESFESNLGSVISMDDHTAHLSFSSGMFSTDEDFELQYSLNQEEIGVFGFSNYLTPGYLPTCDIYSPGFIGFIAEPPVNEDVESIPKAFTLIIDQSGSMNGVKMDQAKQAASFIVNNLNPNDEFNLIAFQSTANAFSSSLLEATTGNVNSALNWINNLYADGGTNCLSAFEVAIPQYAASDDNAAHIMMYFTDGEDQSSTQDIIEELEELSAFYSPNLTIFSFGIGDYVNEQLLASVANNFNGLVEFAPSGDLEEVLSDFYLLIQNPVLLNPEITFDPPIITEIYPQPLQNLYLGEQLQLFGRYGDLSQDSILVQLTGDTYGQEVSYEYYLSIADSTTEDYLFLAKMWADQKIKSLQLEYYLSNNSSVQDELQEEIIDISLCYSVVSDFTSLVDGSEEEEDDDDEIVSVFEEEIETEIESDITVFPNPVVDFVEFQFPPISNDVTTLTIYDTQGRLIYELMLTYGITSLTIDFEKDINQDLSPGIYTVQITNQHNLKTTRFIKS